MEERPATSGDVSADAAAALAPGLLCVAEYANNTLAVVDPATGEILQRIAAGQNPATALVADGWVSVGSSGGGEVTAVNIADPSQVTSWANSHSGCATTKRRVFSMWEIISHRASISLIRS